MTILNLSDAECMSDFLCSPADAGHISDNAQYDSMCIPFQYTPDFCEWLVEKFYLPFAQKARLVGVKRAYLPVLRWCLKQPPLSFFNAEKIQRETGLGLKQIKLVLDICAQAAEDVNRGFHSLADDVTTRNFPLICLRGMYRTFSSIPISFRLRFVSVSIRNSRKESGILTAIWASLWRL